MTGKDNRSKRMCQGEKESINEFKVKELMQKE